MRHALALLVGLTLAGCPPFDEADQAPAPLGPVAAGGQILTADADTSELVAVTVEAGRVGTIERHALAGVPTRLELLPDASGVLVLESDDHLVERVSVPDGERTTWDVGAPFEALSVSPDSDTAIAYYPPGTAGAVFHNANEIAHVDLRPEVPPEDAVVRRTLASLGGAPISVHPSPLVGGRRFAFVLSEEHVAILDLSDPTSRERSVPLVSLNTGGQRTPDTIRFAVDRSGDAEALWAVVTTLEGHSVYALRVFDSVPTEADEPDFDVRLSQLAGFTPGGAVDLVTLPDGRLAAVVLSPSAGTATITYLATGNSDSVHLGPGVNRLSVYEEDGRPVALVFRSGGTAFHILDVAAVAEKKDKAFRTRFAADGISDVHPVAGTPMFVALHDSADEAVSVIDADTDRVTSFGRTGAVRDMVLAPSLGRLYLLTGLGADDYVVGVRLDNLHPTAARVPAGADRLLLLPSAGTVAASAGVSGGHLALWPADRTHDGATHVVPAYLLDGLLDRAPNR
ncbi:MAG: hypothetical protein ACQEXJ_09720 [Myxococcota bacterium]